MDGTDVVIVGRGPASLLMATLIADAGGRVTIVSDGQGSLPLWGGQFDFRNYDDYGAALRDPWAWWAGRPDHPGGTITGSQWTLLWEHLWQVWQRIGIPMRDSLPRQNVMLLTPLGRLRPTFLAPSWHFTQDRAGGITVVSVPGLLDFQAHAVARYYQAETGQTADVMEISVPSTWNERWQSLQWAWFLESAEGQRWLLRELSPARGPSGRPLVFPQMLGMDHAETLMQSMVEVTERPVGEVPLVPPAVGGLRLQRRWETWLRRQGVRFVAGRVSEVTQRNVLVLTNGRRMPAGHLVVATGGVLGGGLRVLPDGRLRDSLTGIEIGLAGSPTEMGSIGHALKTNGPVVAGRQIGGCDPDRHGDGGAMILWTVHQGYEALLQRSVRAEER